MAHITDLHLDILNVIVVLIATSDDGARDLARAGATCKMLMEQVLDPRVLRVVNFQRMTNTNEFTMHHHVHDLLCICAISGNSAAQSILGKTMKLTLFNSGPEYVRNHLTFCSFDGVEVQLEPPQEASYRDTVIDLFDKLFPFARG
ncbi:hypothetical protein L1887_22327 [Cichorium endivia]|nr:hypothetical protein L1887_22327 [Cichorium endivia]